MRFMTFFLILATFATMGKSQLINYGNLTRVQGGYTPKNGVLTKYVAYMYVWKSKGGGGMFCGGTIIGNRAILTAAHCVLFEIRGGEKIAPASLIYLGTGTDIRDDSGKEGKQYKVKKIIKHRDYYRKLSRRGPMRNDIAILILSEDIIFNKDTQKVTLADSRPVGFKKCTAVGWGSLFYNGPMPKHINYADLTVLDNKYCKLVNPAVHEDSTFCAYHEREEVGVCSGDSGGPLFCDGKLAGVSSFAATTCAQLQYPSFFMDVNYYRDWIARNASSYLRSGSYFERFLLVLIIFLMLTV